MLNARVIKSWVHNTKIFRQNLQGRQLWWNSFVQQPRDFMIPALSYGFVM